jgi:drug/metabolite transporter (DMT)-like permease
MLFVLAAVWGASFVFMRNAVPALGPWLLPLVRCGLAAIAMTAWIYATGRRLRFRTHGRFYVLVGVFGAGIPFPLFAYAAQHLPAAYSAVINATVPLWGALLASLWLKESFNWPKALGILTGLAGVSVLVGVGPVALTSEVVLSALAVLLACACYAVAQVGARRWASHVDPFELSAGLLIVSTVLLLPAVPLAWPQSMPSGFVWMNAIALALLSSAYATAHYMRMVVQVGPLRAMTVTFLIPMFGILWGALFLGEPVGWGTLAGCAMVLCATALVIAGTPGAASALQHGLVEPAQPRRD